MKTTPKEVLQEAPREREEFLAEHNLHACQAELNRIKQAIRDGRLWEHIEMRTHAHPALFTSLKKLKHYAEFIQKFSPTVKQGGLFYFSSAGLTRPEISVYKQRMLNRYIQPKNTRVLALVPQTPKKPMHEAYEFNIIKQTFRKLGAVLYNQVHVCFYAAPFGVIPLELDEVYPLSQHETALPLDHETVNYVAKTVSEYVKQGQYKTVVLLHKPNFWGNIVKEHCIKSCQEKGVTFECIDIIAEGSKTILTRLETVLRKQLSEKP